MKCPYCESEMEKGKTNFISMQGFGSMLLSFSPDADVNKKQFITRTHDKIIFSGSRFEAYYCYFCKTIVTVTKQDEFK